MVSDAGRVSATSKAPHPGPSTEAGKAESSEPSERCSLRTEQRATLVVTGALLVVTMFAIRNKCIATIGAPGLTTRSKDATNGASLLLEGMASNLIKTFVILLS